jgi:predicted O-methyltransferase YrrM
MKKFESIFKDGLEDFINVRLVQRPNPFFEVMEERAKVRNVPILSPAAGEVLRYLVKTKNPQNILELGTGLGYSTAWMLSGLEQVQITTIERNEKLVQTAKEFLKPHIQKSQKVEFLKMGCVEYLQTNDLAKYDLFFIDCDKIFYPEILDLLKPYKKEGVSFIFDNVLWHGRLDPTLYDRPSDRAIQKLWEMVFTLDWERTLFSAGDGLLLFP